MFYTPGWGAGGRVWVPGYCSTATGFADEIATAIGRVNAIAELANAVISLSLRWVALQRPCKDGYRRPPTSGM